MAKFTKKPVTVEAITFQELVDHGRRVAPESINGGMPWSFTYAGHHISHENDTCYLIPTLEGTMKMGPGDMLITGVQGEIYPCKLDIFEATYGSVPIMADGSAADPEKFGVVAIDAFPVIDPGPDSLEREIQAKGLTAPRVTPADLQANIVHTEIVKHVSPSGQVLRWAVLTTRNGFAVTGRPSASVSSANDNAEIGQQVAIENAKQELWPLMGYALRDELARPVLTDADAAADLAGIPRPT